ncbi:putative bifunctional diguanylate cyclase/phosphodiesterase [Halomonas rhizosphaerae]|uniref:EAL domain-containing protein n=1 Tax=Halomonas rhizosphaerae TaxID=3043296 RepID=A0ABT6V4A7_9GAMM|nr:EAL domain-containing protein [Halomonas rhizosphaerae]MDI5892338.1 EAL domain-containing protein [Halomonas rhizosphaerae]
MDLNNRDLALQAILLILLAGSLLMGLGGLLLDLFPRFPMPPQLDISLDGSLAILMIGGGLTGVVRGNRCCRVAALLGMLALGGYSLGHNLLAGAEDDGLSWLTGRRRLHTTPALLTLLVALCCAVGIASEWRRRVWRTAGGLALVLGLLGVAALLGPGTPPLLAWLAHDFTMLGALFSVVLGAGMLIIADHHSRPILALPRHAVTVGVTGVVLSMALWLLGSWTQHNEQLASAEKLAGNLAMNLEEVTRSRAELIQRMAKRWQAAGGLPETQVREEEARNYFKDEASLQALAFLDGEKQSLWRRGRHPGALLWLMDRLVEPETLAWLREVERQGSEMAWRFPDPARPRMVTLAVRASGNSDQLMLAVLDLDVLIHETMRRNTGDFRVTIAGAGQPISVLPPPSPSDGWHPLATAEARLPDGPRLTLTAAATPPLFASLHGILPLGAGLVGLLLTYQLIIGRSLVAIRDEQARALSTSEQRFRSLFTQHPDAVFAMDRHGTYRSLNPMTQAIIGMGERDWRGLTFRDIVHEDSTSSIDLQRVEAGFQTAASGRPHSLTMRYHRQDAPPQDLEVTFLPILVNGQVDGVFGIAKNISERIAAAERQRILERSLEASSNAVVITDARQPGHPAVYVNPAFTRITGYLARDVLGQSPRFLGGPDTDARDVAQIRAALAEGRTLSITLRAHRRDGSPFWNQVFLSPVHDDDGVVTHFVAIMNDISERKEQENQLAYQATHDALTGLANRALFGDRLVHDVALARRHAQILAVLFIDLDEFKPINDTLGHKVGDQLLISVARRLATGLRVSDTLARFGGDEFVLLLPDLDHPGEAEEVAERLLLQLSRPHKVNGHELHISASIGIALNDEPRQDPEKLLQHADMAMYKAKQQGRNAFQCYTGDLDSKLSLRVMLRNELQEAIDHDQLVLHYQPLLDAAGRVDGLEALVRWRHPVKGFISPADFIPLSEETGQIIPLSRWVMAQACRDARTLVDQGLLAGRMAVNLSPMQFHRPSFLATLRGVLDETGLPASHLELELTEGILMRDTEGAIDILNALNGMGISTAIDDFGTGFSSLGYLRTLPIDKIKIDRTFVKHVTESDKDAAICQGVITLARELDLRVVAEGIETHDQHDYLRHHGCEVFQGYLFARPMPLDALVEWLEAHPRP